MAVVPFLLAMAVVFSNVFDSRRKEHLIEYLNVALSQLLRLHCEIRELFIARPARRSLGINSFSR